MSIATTKQVEQVGQVEQVEQVEQVDDIAHLSSCDWGVVDTGVRLVDTPAGGWKQ